MTNQGTLQNALGTPGRDVDICVACGVDEANLVDDVQPVADWPVRPTYDATGRPMD